MKIFVLLDEFDLLMRILSRINKSLTCCAIVDDLTGPVTLHDASLDASHEQ